MSSILERLDVGLEVKFANEKEGTFSGYGAVFGNVDSYGDVIERGAFKQTLREWEEKRDLPPMLLQHGGSFLGRTAEDGIPVGVWTSMEENSRGLKVEGELLALDTDLGKRLHAAMKRGRLKGLSIGFQPRKDRKGTKAGEPRRWLQDIDLKEVSIVTFAANDKAHTTHVRSSVIDEINTPADAEAVLREAGWSKKQATDFVGRLFKIARREAGDDQGLSKLLESMKSMRRLIVSF